MGRPRTCDCGECTKCKHRERQHARYQAMTMEQRREMRARRDPERARAVDRARAQKPERRAAQTAQAKSYVTRNPEKYAAYKLVNVAVRNGTLMPGTCEVCGSERVVGHHDDYSKPLEVRWLCRLHHAAHHKEIRCRSQLS